jgi:hypothetical protein
MGMAARVYKGTTTHAFLYLTIAIYDIIYDMRRSLYMLLLKF